VPCHGYPRLLFRSAHHTIFTMSCPMRERARAVQCPA
jgi:hypothetical protein